MPGFARRTLHAWAAEHDAALPAALSELSKPAAGWPAAAPPPAEALRLDRFLWARCVLWSRSVDVTVPAKRPAGSDPRWPAPPPVTSLRLMAPMLDFMNHSPAPQMALRWDAQSGAVELSSPLALASGREARPGVRVPAPGCSSGLQLRAARSGSCGEGEAAEPAPLCGG